MSKKTYTTGGGKIHEITVEKSEDSSKNGEISVSMKRSSSDAAFAEFVTQMRAILIKLSKLDNDRRRPYKLRIGDARRACDFYDIPSAVIDRETNKIIAALEESELLNVVQVQAAKYALGISDDRRPRR